MDNTQETIVRSFDNYIKYGKAICILFAFIFLSIGVYSCSKDKEDCDTCRGQFIHVVDGDYIYLSTDCNRKSPDGYVFVKCLDEYWNMHPTRIFKTEDELEIAWKGYKDNLKEQAKEWQKVQYVGKEGDKKEDAQKIPMTMEGFERYCYENHGCVNQYFDNKDGLYSEFVTICSRIRKEIRENQIIGGMLGFFNPSITQRLNGLSDRKEIDHKVEMNIPNIPDIGKR